MYAVCVLALVCPNALEGRFAEVDAIVNGDMMVGAQRMIRQQQSLRAINTVVSSNSP